MSSTSKDPSPPDTRTRIVEATVALHEEVGPAATTITAVAERAGVQRLTVYRHMPDERALIGACSAHWAERHPLPDASGWVGIEDPGTRLRSALNEVYAFFAGGRDMLRQVLRDEDRVPALAEVLVPFHAWFRETAGQLSAGWGLDPPRQRRMRAFIGHALRFETWHSLDAEGLTPPDAADLVADLARCLARTTAGGSGE